MKYLFVGNRKFVLEEMISKNLDLVEVLVVENSHLHREIDSFNLPYKVISKKVELIDVIQSVDFDVLVANGCKYILPVNKLKKAKYVNIHPSYLPDLRGVDPVVGSILYQRNSGATCHIIDEGIDTGKIISRVKIPYTEDLDVALLYQMSFIAEKEVFNLAFEKKFNTDIDQEEIDNLIYYKRCENDQTILKTDSCFDIVNKVKAFGNKSQGVKFFVNESSYLTYGASVINNYYLNKIAHNYEDNQIFMSFENSILIKRSGQVLKLSDIKPENVLGVGNVIS